MKKVEINTLALNEIRWEDKGNFLSEDFRVIYSGRNKTGLRSVALILRDDWRNKGMFAIQTCSALNYRVRGDLAGSRTQK
ncbi:hypothetical protein J437_LFUL009037, partial [Ladona fulva]